jgi:hypothetical protein
LEKGLLEMNASSLYMFCDVVPLTKKKPGRGKRRKNRCCSEGRLQHEKHTAALPVDRSDVEVQAVIPLKKDEMGGELKQRSH